jgi:hypothetical protein
VDVVFTPFEIAKRETPISGGGAAVSTTKAEDSSLVEASCQQTGESGFGESRVPWVNVF